jgi:hypothetical protein
MSIVPREANEPSRHLQGFIQSKLDEALNLLNQASDGDLAITANTSELWLSTFFPILLKNPSLRKVRGTMIMHTQRYSEIY